MAAQYRSLVQSVRIANREFRNDGVFFVLFSIA